MEYLRYRTTVRAGFVDVEYVQFTQDPMCKKDPLLLKHSGVTVLKFLISFDKVTYLHFTLCITT